MPFKFNSLSKMHVTFDVSDVVNGTLQDPTGLGGSVAFTTPGVLPVSSDWTTASWAIAENAQAGSVFGLQVLVGPNDGNAPFPNVTLAEGTWVGWTMVNAGDEIWVNMSDTVRIDGVNYRIPIVTISDLSDYMGYPFSADQIFAVESVIHGLTAQAENILQADLSQQQWVELYTVPWDQAQPFMNAYIGVDYASIYPNSDAFNLGMAVGLVKTKHWPVVSWDALAVNTSASVASSPTDPTASWVQLTPPAYPEPLPLFVPGTQVMVTYTAGWDGPALYDLQLIIKRAAARELTNRLDDAVGLKGFSTVRLPDGSSASMAPGFTPDEMAQLLGSRYKQRVVVG